MNKEEMKEVKQTEEELSDKVELVDDLGKVRQFYHIGTMDYKKEWYAFFQPAEKMDGIDTDEVVIFKISGTEGEEVLLPVEDDMLLEEVYNKFMKEFEDEEEVLDEEFQVDGGCSKKCSNCKNKK